jgi:hypothetical protein
MVHRTLDIVIGHAGQPAGATEPAWRGWNFVGLTCLSAYSTGIAWQAQLVSYPLYRAVASEDFLDYHAQYNHSIPAVVIAPGFATFLLAGAFLWTRPRSVPLGAAAVVSASGLVSLLSTVLWAIPRHNQLDREGQSEAVIDSLLRANEVRTAALTVGTVALAWIVGRALRRRSSA